MVHTSKSGLMPAPRIFMKSSEMKNEPILEFQSCVRPVKFTLKPLSTLANPYRHGCSILCNHPSTNVDLRKAIKRTTRTKNEPDDCGVDKKALVDRVGEVLEEMLLSRYRRDEGGAIVTKESCSPVELLEGDKSPTGGAPRTVLVLDLRRTASQETVATREGRETLADEISAVASPTQSSVSAASHSLNFAIKRPTTPPPSNETNLQIPVVTETPVEAGTTTDEGGLDEADVQRRRGKVRKKKKSGKNITVLPDDRGSKEVVGLIEPGETQVSAIKESGGEDYRSGQTSATPGVEGTATQLGLPDNQQPEILFPLSDLFDQKTLRHLRRSYSVHDAEAHFRSIWRKVLEEAAKACDVNPEAEMQLVAERVNIEPCEPRNWISYPRAFAFNRARFDLPINKDLLNDMTPLEYLRDYVAISKRHNLLYDFVFDKYREFKACQDTRDEGSKQEGDEELLEQKESMDPMEKDEEKTKPNEGVQSQLDDLENDIDQESDEEAEVKREKERFMLAKSIIPALGEVMSRPFTDEEQAKFREMVSWNDEDIIDLRTWIGLCALAERVFGHQFSSGKEPKLGREQEIERVDFEDLTEKLPRLNLRPDLHKLLTSVREACERMAENDLYADVYGFNDPPSAPVSAVGADGNQILRRPIRIGFLDEDDSDAEDFNMEPEEPEDVTPGEPDDVTPGEPEDLTPCEPEDVVAPSELTDVEEVGVEDA